MFLNFILLYCLMNERKTLKMFKTLTPSARKNLKVIESPTMNIFQRLTENKIWSNILFTFHICYNINSLFYNPQIKFIPTLF